MSVLLPAYNAGRHIEISINSILRQSYTKIELIVIDDGSTDRTSSIAQAAAERDPRVIYLHKANSGIVDALNLGLTVASGSLIARQDADDISTSSRIEKQISYLQERPGCIAVSGAHFHIDDEGDFTGGRHYPTNRGSGDYTAYPALEPYLPHPFLMMRADILKGLKYRYTFHCEDSDLYWRAARAGTLENMPEILGLYRVHSASISGTSIVEGRIQAVYSQLAAISASRYDLMKPDLEFDRESLQVCREARSLEGMISHFESRLRPREVEYLRVSAIIKLIELAGLRPYRLQDEDLAYLKKYASPKKVRGTENRRSVRRAVRGYFRRRGILPLLKYYAGL